ncbi:MAG TPA: hypothetical protein VG502_04980 [Flexivirga sp.]|uniref:hypothetical protein n=1 Tax=Flexivirga sp. TaxID=1962927 RepID=UPI002B91BE25|nr:hypothetical protein [Flexivirga sp.]HWC21638.1 hypothetical protein [Flexivirga sp.]
MGIPRLLTVTITAVAAVGTIAVAPAQADTEPTPGTSAYAGPTIPGPAGNPVWARPSTQRLGAALTWVSCGATGTDAAIAVKLAGAMTYSRMGRRLSAEQAGCARRIVAASRASGLDRKAAEIALMTAIVETTLRNYTGGDLDSVGLFQQRNSWGSYAQRIRPESATAKFLSVMQQFYPRNGWLKASAGQVAADVQRPAAAYRGEYALAQTSADALLNVLWPLPVAAPAPGPAKPPASLAGFGDVTGDRVLDRIAYRSDLRGGSIRLYRGWTTGITLGSGLNQYRALLRGDFDGNGSAELLGVAADGHLVRYAIGRNGTLGAGTRVAGSSGWAAYSQFVVVNDLGRRAAQRRVGITTSGNVTYFGSRTVTTRNLIPLTIYKQPLPVRDLNGDGLSDLVAVRRATGRLTAFYAHANGTYSKGPEFGTGFWNRFRAITSDGNGVLRGIDAKPQVQRAYVVRNVRPGGVRLLGVGRGSWAPYAGLL